MTKPKKPAPNPLSVVRLPGETEAQALAGAAIHAGTNAAIVVHAFQGNLLGSDASLDGLVDGLKASMSRSNDGDLSTLEAMLIGQATALQSIFTSLALRAQAQTSQRNLEAFLGLALKAQAQSRATITALVDLKHPRQAMFVKQANIAHGPQQVNNGVVGTGLQAAPALAPMAIEAPKLGDWIPAHSIGDAPEAAARTGKKLGPSNQTIGPSAP